MTWLRARFFGNADDYRPVKWPPPGPFWCTGYGSAGAVIVAYVRSEDQITEFWPEAEHIEASPAEKPEFSGRFPKPSWWNE